MRARLVAAAGTLMLGVGSAWAGQGRSDDPVAVLRREPVVVWLLQSGYPAAEPPPGSIAAIMPPQPRLPLKEVTVSGLGEVPAASAPASAASAGRRPNDWVLVAVSMNRIQGASVSYVDLYAEDLKKELKAAKEKNALPDVLVGELAQTAESGQGEAGQRDALFLPTSIYTKVYPDNLPVLTRRPVLQIFRQAPHPAAARALAQLVSECCSVSVPELSTEAKTRPGMVAVGAISRLWHGQMLGTDADPMLAEFSLDRVMRSWTLADVRPGEDAEPEIQVMDELVDGGLAAISLRVIASSEKSFVLRHPLVVLRRAADGSWKVVQVSFDLRVERQRDGAERLMHSSPTSLEERRGGVKGVSVASPRDGELRAAQPELWWDNLGGAGLQVVEWQESAGTGGPWPDTHLYFVRDMDSLLHTREVARFATAVGARYRWRVWSVGDQGELKLSAWRTFGVLP